MSLQDSIDRLLVDALTDASAASTVTSVEDLAARLANRSPDDLRAYLGSLVRHLQQRMTLARVVVTGEHWIGGGYGSVDTALMDLVGKAEREIAMTVYSFGAQVDRVLDRIDERLGCGIRVGMVVNDLDLQPPDLVRRLRRSSERFAHFTLRPRGSPKSGQA